MPPYQKNRTVWHNVSLQVTVEIDPKRTKNAHSVVVTFTRVGYSNETQQPVREELSRRTILSGLGPQQADAFKLTIQALCDETYAQGYSAAKGTHTI